MIIAIDTENGQAFGPFETHEQADERIARFMVELGEWRRGEDVASVSRYDADFELMLDHFLDEDAGADGHEDRDACRAILCSAVDEAGWQVMEMQTLEPGDGLGDDIHEQRHPGQQADRVLEPGAGRSEPAEQPVAAGSAQDQPQLIATAHLGHGHDASDGADGRDAHAS